MRKPLVVDQPSSGIPIACQAKTSYSFILPTPENPERPFAVVKEEIHIGVFSCLASRRRAEQVEMLDAELLQLGFVLLELGDDFAAFHRYRGNGTAQHKAGFFPMPAGAAGASAKRAADQTRRGRWGLQGRHVRSGRSSTRSSARISGIFDVVD